MVNFVDFFVAIEIVNGNISRRKEEIFLVDSHGSIYTFSSRK